ncbi:MAG: tripartite tricarboxylate transporter substrate binding protein BugD, partial [Alphaproteobacteria bacterium]|nr:tripartite tricarboxylate transporter substrate binding protein BugD [Alphaproteobacteria bacterium]
MISRRILAAAMAAFALGLSSQALAQANYPTRPITVVVPFAAGGPTDALARILSAKMTEKLGQQIVVENIGGAGGTIGVAKVARANPDGYTLSFTHMGTLAVNIALYKSLPYDSVKDFEPIGLGGTNPMVLVTKKALPAKDFKEFQAYVKANESKVQYGMAGIGAASHLGGLMLNSMMKVNVLEIPYKGTGPALNDLVAGQFDYMVDQAVNVLA